MSVLTDDFGKKPVLPPWTSIDPSQNQLDTVTGNTGVLPSAQALGTAVNTYNLAELERMFGLSSATLKKIGENIGSQAKGEVPKDVQDFLQRTLASKNLNKGTGFGGGNVGTFGGNDFARTLGLTSYGIMNEGKDSAIRWLASAKANSFDVTSMFLTPSQRYAQTGNERDLLFGYKKLEAEYEAMPDPATRGIMDAIRAAGIAYLGGNYQTGTDYTSTKGTRDYDSQGRYMGGPGTSGGGSESGGSGNSSGGGSYWGDYYESEGRG